MILRISLINASPH